MSKRPAFQFYPSDWRTDQDLRGCSAAARGLWADMLCLMHDGEPYGHLTDLGLPMLPETLAKLTGEAVRDVRKWLAELRGRRVFSETEDGVIFSRRMVRDEAVREARAAGGPAGGEHGYKGGHHGAKGGRPKGPKPGSSESGRGDKKPPLKPPPSSSSSASPELAAPTGQANSGRDAPALPCEGQPASAPVVYIKDLPKAERVALAAGATVGLGGRRAH